MKALWIAGGFGALLLGLVGIVLPLFPTVPFLLLAAFCFARSSQHLHDWLTTHPRLGPPIARWNESGAISRQAKRLATVSSPFACGIGVFWGLRWWIWAVQGAALTAV